MDYNSFEYLKKTLSKIYNKEDVEAIIEENFPETLSIPEHRPQQSNSVRHTSPTSDSMTYTVRNKQEDDPRCNYVFCTIM